MRIMTTLLSYDHGILRQVLDVINDIAVEGTLERYRDLMPEISDFLLDFMGRYHHGREELFLFPAAEGSSESIRAMIPWMIDEHRTVKGYAEAIADNVAEWETGPLAQNIIDLVAHMVDHIKEEEDVLFPGLQSSIGPEADLTAFERSQAFIADEFGEDVIKRGEELAGRLQRRVWGDRTIRPLSPER
jgi:hemerythrin-like domain-containing protein